MTIQECYQQLGGDYAQVELRLTSAALVKRFITKFLEDKSFEQLCQAFASGNREESFRAAHTLKGVCANLGFDRLLSSAGDLSEILRTANDTIPAEAASLLTTVQRDYAQTVETISAFLNDDQ